MIGLLIGIANAITGRKNAVKNYYYYYSDSDSEDNGIGSSNLELDNDGLPILNDSNINEAVEDYMNGLLQDIENWDVSAVTNMDYLFSAKKENSHLYLLSELDAWKALFQNFNADISSWDVSNVTSMSNMFRMSYFNQDIGNWDVSSVTNMNETFGQSQFNQDIGNWDVSSVTNMGSMFGYAYSFNQDISSWDVSNVDTLGDMFKGSSLSTSNYDALLIGWEATLQTAYPSGSGYTFSPNINFGTVTHTTGGSAEAAKNSLISTFNWTITDGNP